MFRPNEAPPPSPPGDWPTRVLALVPLVALALLWSNHHLGVGAGHPATMAALAAALPVGLGLVTRLLDKAEQETVSARLRNAVARVLTWRVLLVLYLALGVVVLTWTSVVVQGDEPLGNATLQALDAPGTAPLQRAAGAKTEPLRFVVPTRPFGRPFLLTLEGYVPQPLEAFPLTGVRLRPGRELRRSPSVLLRVSDLALGSWRDAGGAELRVVATRAPGTPIFSTREPAAALLLGRPQPVPVSWQSQWRLDLLAAGLTDEPAIARWLTAWRRPVPMRPAAALEPGTVLRATLTTLRNGKLVAQAEFELGRDELQDQAMEDLPE